MVKLKNILLNIENVKTLIVIYLKGKKTLLVPSIICSKSGNEFEKLFLEESNEKCCFNEKFIITLKIWQKKS